MTAYSRLQDQQPKRKKGKSGLDRFLSLIPYYFSHLILLTTWFLFMLFIALGEVLIRRRELGRFVEQVIIYHFLLGMTLISLMTTANRAPAKPDQTLAPQRPKLLVMSAPNSYSAQEPADSPDPIDDNNEDDDDVPLRFLRNANWVNTRIGKDRPSPLPLPSTKRYPSLPPGPSLTPGSSFSNEDGGEETESEYSPFPLSAKSPFVPRTTEDAGEDDDDVAQEEAIDQMVEERSPSSSDQASDGLLTSRTDGSEARSLMAKSNTGKERWCKKCDAWKPDRCHHCRHCDQCVLKMDHHCPWVGSCVGYHNYKAFFLFVNYATLLAIYVTIEAGYETFRFFQDPDAAIPHSKIVQLQGSSNGTSTCTPGETCQPAASPSQTWSDGLGLSPAVFMMLFAMGGFMSLAMIGLTCFHWYLVTHNQTTLENITHSYPSALMDTKPVGKEWKADHLLTRAERFRLRSEAREVNVYDLGWKRNLRDLLVGGKDHSHTGKIYWIKAFWPAGRVDRNDARAGHFFPYDADKFDRLRELTLELRYGVKRVRDEVTSISRDSASMDEGEDAVGEEEKMLSHRNRYDGRRGAGVEMAGGRGGTRGSNVKWFEA